MECFPEIRINKVQLQATAWVVSLTNADRKESDTEEFTYMILFIYDSYRIYDSTIKF